MTTIIETYKAKDGWRWRMLAENGRIIADGGEAYTRRHGLGRAVKRLVARLSGGKVIVRDIG